ncbi:hypothetical protein LXA62_18155, partial [Erwinia amylovora]|nr:hypothetical protein [Erwinia amylovora]
AINKNALAGELRNFTCIYEDYHDPLQDYIRLYCEHFESLLTRQILDLFRQQDIIIPLANFVYCT